MTDPIMLPARLDAPVVMDLAARFSQVPQGGSIAVDASAVTHMGALAAQLLISAARTFRQTGGQLSIVAISTRAADQLSSMGLTPTTLSEGVL